MQVLIATPYPLTNSKGNTITANRIEKILNDAGIQAKAIHSTTPPQADTLINLHATKTYPSALHFKAKYPNAKLITLITGTDINTDLPQNHPLIHKAFELADTIAVPHSLSIPLIPEKYRHKTALIPSSIILPSLESITPPPTPSIILPGHLRHVKNPFLLNRALELIPNIPLHAYTLGAELEDGYAEQAHQWEQKDARFHYLGDIPHPQTLSWMKHATLTLNTSHQEGGSNSIAESITLGTPVLASNIPGNIGMLTHDYPGLFQANNPQSLATLIERILASSTLLKKIKIATESISQRFLPQMETKAWLQHLNPPK